MKVLNIKRDDFERIPRMVMRIMMKRWIERRKRRENL